jgi:hypothetical protein
MIYQNLLINVGVGVTNGSLLVNNFILLVLLPFAGQSGKPKIKPALKGNLLGTLLR